MKRFAIPAILLLGVVFTASQCRRHYCHMGHHKMSEKFANKAVKRISSKLDLDDTQKAKLESIKNELMAKGKTFKGFRKEVASEVVAQAKQDKVDTAKLNQLFDNKQKDMTEMRQLMISKYAEFHAMLKPEQRAKMVKYMEKFQQRCHKD